MGLPNELSVAVSSETAARRAWLLGRTRVGRRSPAVACSIRLLGGCAFQGRRFDLPVRRNLDFRRHMFQLQVSSIFSPARRRWRRPMATTCLPSRLAGGTPAYGDGTSTVCVGHDPDQQLILLDAIAFVDEPLDDLFHNGSAGFGHPSCAIYCSLWVSIIPYYWVSDAHPIRWSGDARPTT